MWYSVSIMEKICDRCKGAGKFFVLTPPSILACSTWCGDGIISETCSDCNGTGLELPACCPTCGKRLPHEPQNSDRV